MLKKYAPKFSKNIKSFLGRIFSKIPISPNSWTFLSLLFAIFGFYALYSKNLLVGIILFSISGLIDAIDGAVAQHQNKKTHLGAYLDGIIDRIVEALLLIGLMFFEIPEFYIPGYIWLTLLLFFGSAMTSFAKAYADHQKVIPTIKIEKMDGLLERAERIILIITGMIFGYIKTPEYITYFIIIAVILSIITFTQRINYTIKNANRG
ncbi:CDP-alcohol phosphatidyltransferase family protein [archaeon]|nr:CDP-alcohol phosphatidyltransferase family protein [archaeon]